MHAPQEVDQVHAQLIDFVRRLERNPFGWRAVHLHLSQLKAHHRRDYQLRVAASEFDRLLRRLRSELFQLANGDIVFFWEGASVEQVDRVVLRLRYLFSDDPLVAAEESEADCEVDEDGEVGRAAQPTLCTWHDLEDDYTTFCFGLEDLVENLSAHAADAPPAAESRGLEPSTLARLEKDLETTDISKLLRRQPVCAFLPKAPPQPIFREVHVAMPELGKRLAAGVDLTADTWWFQHLAETLDRRMLASLAAQEEEAEEAVSVNLRLATLLSPDFLEFDHKFRQHNRLQAIIELQLIDIFAELGVYLFIREFIRERGYRVCIDGLHHLHLPLVNRKRLGADLVKLVWSPEMLHELDDVRGRQLEDAIKRTGADRVILCRCDSAEAIEWGQSVGIKLFQGHYVDSRLRAARSPAVAAARQALRGAGGEA
jgi:EAL domain-containing protein (putative c-di-GMP-specific phosphodiesterase class I)